MQSLFDPITLGDLTISNRVIMAPLTRMRSSQPGNVPNDLMAEYYAQRAGAGLIIAEATQILPEGQGYPGTPGVHSAQQVEGWKKVTAAVHAKGGKIFLQLWHVGRISHSSFQPDGGAPWAPSAIKPDGQTMTAQWSMADYETPREISLDAIPALIDAYAAAARHAKEAGFDGVEVHGANGYLLDQFLQDGSNTRTDMYGGSVENRTRLLLQVVDAVSAVWGSGRVGVRLSPYGTFNSMSDSDPVALFSHVLEKLSARDLAYVHLIEPRSSSAGGADGNDDSAPQTSRIFRDKYKGTLISAGGYTRDEAMAAVAEGRADAVAFGRLYISNPDLAERLRAGKPLTRYDRSTFYGGGAKGYTDYPAMTEEGVAA